MDAASLAAKFSVRILADWGSRLDHDFRSIHSSGRFQHPIGVGLFDFPICGGLSFISGDSAVVHSKASYASASLTGALRMPL